MMRSDEDEHDFQTKRENGEDDSRSECSTTAYCTFAVTGATTSFQPIFVCHDCFNASEGEESTPLCICQACADTCHDGDDHDVEYIGIGPSYCDCNQNGCCRILDTSNVKAESLLGPQSTRISTVPNENNNQYTHDVFDIPLLYDDVMSSQLVEQAKALVKQSKETFWIDNGSATSNIPLCLLETLALKFFDHHCKEYSHCSQEICNGGAEWWVQIKDPRSSSGKEGAIDLHYDKDEALAEIFGLGSFPILSTVTYLTQPAGDRMFNPTIVLDHEYSQGEDEVINMMLVSRPRLGKHLVFDGRLLHGAPALEDLKVHGTSIQERQQTGAQSPRSDHEEVRVTFLVNIWTQRPASVQRLPGSLRGAVSEATSALTTGSVSLQTLSAALEMTKREVPAVEIKEEADLPGNRRHRIEIPFVSRGTTWEDQLVRPGDGYQINDDDDDTNAGLVVVTFPPPFLTDDDTLLVHFGPGMQGYLDYTDPVTDPSGVPGEANQNHESAYV